MQTSTNYGFRLPDSTDYVSIGDLNYNFGEIDANLLDWIEPTVATALANNLDATLSVQGKAADAKAVGDALALKVNASSIDIYPTQGSMHPVSSGGTYSELARKLDKISTSYSGYTGDIFYIDNANGVTHKTFAANDFLLTGYTNYWGSPAPIAATDSVRTGIAKLQGQLNFDKVASAMKLEGYVAPSPGGRVQAITADDTIVEAIQKLVALINSLQSN